MPKPNPKESKAHFVTRFVSTRKKERPEESTDQSIAIGYSTYEKHKKGDKNGS